MQNTKLTNREGKVPFVVACEEGGISCRLPSFSKRRWSWGRSGSFVIETESEGAAISFLSARRVVSRQSCSGALRTVLFYRNCFQIDHLLTIYSVSKVVLGDQCLEFSISLWLHNTMLCLWSPPSKRACGQPPTFWSWYKRLLHWRPCANSPHSTPVVASSRETLLAL